MNALLQFKREELAAAVVEPWTVLRGERVDARDLLDEGHTSGEVFREEVAVQPKEVGRGLPSFDQVPELQLQRLDLCPSQGFAVLVVATALFRFGLDELLAEEGESKLYFR